MPCVRILSGLVLIGLTMFLVACTAEPVPTSLSATATAIESAAQATIAPSPSADADADDSSSSNAAGELSTAVAARTPIPTPTPGRVEQSVDTIAADTGLAGQTLLGLPAEDWINLGFSILIAVAGYFIVTAVLGRLFSWLVSQTSTQADNVIWTAIRGYAKWLIVLLLIRYSFMRLGFLSSSVRSAADDLFFVVGVTILTKMVLTLINLAVTEARARFTQQEKDGAPSNDARLDPVITALHRVADLFVLITALSIGLVHFGISANAMYIMLLVVGVVISFGAKSLISDAISGMIILVDQPFRPGDSILIADLNTTGDVIRIGTRSTQIRTGDHREVVVPNSKIVQSEVVNYTSPLRNFRVQTKLGVAYGTDMEKVRQTITAAVRGVDGVLVEEKVDVFFQSFGDSSLSVNVRWWIDNFHDEQPMLDKVNSALKIALSQADIDLPYTTYSLQVELDGNHQKSTSTDAQS